MTKKPIKVNWNYRDMPKTSPIFYGFVILIALIIWGFIAYQSLSESLNLFSIIFYGVLIFVLIYIIKEMKITYNLLRKKHGAIKQSQEYFLKQYSPVNSWFGYYISGILLVLLPITIFVGGLIFAYLHKAEVDLISFTVFLLISLFLIILFPKKGSLLIKIARGLKKGDKKFIRLAKKHRIEQY